MALVLGIAVVAYLLLLAAYNIGKRSSTVSVLLTVLLLPVGYYLLLVWRFSHGEGAAAGVVVIAAAAWFVGGLCLALSATMLYASYRVRGSGLAKACLLIVVVPLMVLVAIRVGFSPRDRADPARAVVEAEPKSSYFEGYVWAADNGVVSDQGCSQGTADFIAGCKSWVSKQPARPNK